MTNTPPKRAVRDDRCWLHIVITDTQRDALDARKVETGASIAEITRRALNAYLEIKP